MAGASTSTTTVTGTPSSTTTTTLGQPVNNSSTFAPPGRGCHFDRGVVTSPTTTTSPALGSNATRLHSLGTCTILEVGDSLGNDLGWGLARELTGTPGLRLVQADKSSTGLTTPWFYDWPAHLRTLVAQYHPQLVVMLYGANDEQGLRVNGAAKPFASAAWQSAYTHIVHQMVTDVTSSGSYLLWVGLPVVQPNGYRQGVAYLNTIDQRTVTSVPGATFLPTWDVVANAQHQYESTAKVNGVVSVLRSSDGIHFSYVGEDVYATYVIRMIGATYHVELDAHSPMLIDN